MTRQCLVDDFRGIYRLAETLAERTKMTNMVQMVMRHKYCRKGIHVKILFLKHLLQSSEADPGIYDDSVMLCSKKVAVAAASA